MGIEQWRTSCARSNDGDALHTNGTDDGACLTLAVDNSTKGESRRKTNGFRNKSLVLVWLRGGQAKKERANQIGVGKPHNKWTVSVVEQIGTRDRRSVRMESRPSVAGTSGDAKHRIGGGWRVRA